MFSELHKCLIKHRGERVEITVIDGEVFTGCSTYMDESDQDDLGWFFKDVEGVPYNALCLKDIARVRRVGEQEYDYIADPKLANAV